MMAIRDFDLTATRRQFEALRFHTLALRRRSAALHERAADLRHASAELVHASHRACFAAQAFCGSPRPVPVVETIQRPSILLQGLAACRLGERDVDGLVDGLIAAHRDAMDLGDEELERLLRTALTQVGRHLAERLGPRAAGVRLN